MDSSRRVEGEGDPTLERGGRAVPRATGGVVGAERGVIDVVQHDVTRAVHEGGLDGRDAVAVDGGAAAHLLVSLAERERARAETLDGVAPRAYFPATHTHSMPRSRVSSLAERQFSSTYVRIPRV